MRKRGVLIVDLVRDFLRRLRYRLIVNLCGRHRVAAERRVNGVSLVVTVPDDQRLRLVAIQTAVARINTVRCAGDR